MFFVEAPGAVVFPEDVEKTAGISGGLHTFQDLLHHNGAAPLSPAVRVGVEGDQFPPGGQVGGTEITDGVPGGLIHPGGAIGGAAEGSAVGVEQEAMVDPLLMILAKYRHPAAVGNFPGHIVRRDAVPVGGSPAQGVEEGHIPKVPVFTGIDNLYHKSYLTKEMDGQRPS